MRRRVILAAFVLPLAACVTWDQLEVRALQRDISAIAARGEPITTETDPVGGDSTERHDAARIYAAAAERARAMPQELTFRLGTIDVDNTVGPPLDLTQLEHAYRPDAPALQLLDQATPLDFNGFGDVPFDQNNSPLLTLNGLAAVRADLLSARGQGDAAARALIASVRLWRTMTMFSRFQLSTRLLGSARIMLRHSRPGETALAELQRRLAELPDTDDMARDVQLRRARFIDEIERPRESATEAVLVRLLRPWLVHTHRRALANYQEALAIARRPWPDKFILGSLVEGRYGPAVRPLGSRSLFARMTGGLIAPEGMGIIGLAHTQAGLELAARRVTLTALATERFRRAHEEAAPASLQDLVPAYLPSVPLDPFSGAPLVYRRTDRGYLLYSVDINWQDDGGALYGIGSKAQMMPRQGRARDLGIRVDYDK